MLKCLLIQNSRNTFRRETRISLRTSLNLSLKTMTSQANVNYSQLIKEQTEKLRQLRATNADPATMEAEVQRLKELNSLKNGGNSDTTLKADTSKKITVKTPKGTIDYTPADMALRDRIFSTIIKVYRRHGAVTIDTPVFELKEILQGKYGEDSKLIYDLDDQGGEQCSLRYDLTVPFARYLAMNTDCKTPMKRYHIAKVYRRDQPAVTKGRMREFYQCDYDISGTFEPMIPDAEVVRTMHEVLSELEIGEFSIKINHRKLLDGMFEVCGVPQDKFRTICSAVDKLDKTPWDAVKNEMVNEKGLDASVADRIGEYVKLKGSKELIEKLHQDSQLYGNTRAKEGLDDLKLLFKYLEIFGVLNRVSFDLSLARGLDYYTGVIYEAVVGGGVSTSQSKNEDFNVGSIAGGGRYDDLVGMFAGKNSKIPCVGFSIGVERVFSILKHNAAQANKPLRQIFTDVLVVAIDGLLEERMKICTELWNAGINADFVYKAKPKLVKQLEVCDKDENQIPYAVVFGSEELSQGYVRLKDMRLISNSGVEEKKGTIVRREDLVSVLKTKLDK